MDLFHRNIKETRWRTESTIQGGAILISPEILFLAAFSSIIQLWETKIVRDKANCFSDGSQTTIVAYCWRFIWAAAQIPEKPLI